MFGGYNVYRNGDKLNAETTTDTVFVDNESVNEKYLSYQVSAVYSLTGEKYSNKVTIVASGINGVSGKSGVKVKTVGSRLIVLGAHQGDVIAVYSADGKQQSSVIATDDYSQSIDLSSVSAGVYVVKVGRDTFKLSVSAK